MHVDATCAADSLLCLLLLPLPVQVAAPWPLPSSAQTLTVPPQTPQPLQLAQQQQQVGGQGVSLNIDTGGTQAAGLAPPVGASTLYKDGPPVAALLPLLPSNHPHP
jgi:hypothetical protein